VATDGKIGSYPPIPEGTLVRAGDRDNFGYLVENYQSGPTALVNFRAKDGSEKTTRIARNLLTLVSGGPPATHADRPAIAGRVGGKEPTGPLDDRRAGRWVVRAEQGKAIPDDVLRRLGPWTDGAMLAMQAAEGDRAAEVDRWLDSVRARDPVAAGVYRTAVVEARTIADLGDDEPAEDAPPPFKLDIVGSSEFVRSIYTREWFIKRILVKQRPCVFGGPQKSLKTSQVIDLVISLATATRFMGEFEVPHPTKVLLISGESGAGVIQETMRRVSKAKGIDPEDLEGFAFWGFSLPQLNDPEQLAALGRFIQENGIEVVIIDPLYLCLLTGGKKIDPANLFEVGPLLKQVCDLCLNAGATPLLVHHFRKNRENPFGPPEMEDLAFAGIQEFARQWILVNRRERYEPGSGHHKLWLSVGGSDGHSGEWGVDVSEGTIADDFQDREWNVTVHRAAEARAVAKEIATTAKAEKQAEQARIKDLAKADKLRADCDTAMLLLNQAGMPLTGRKWRDTLNWNTGRFGPVQELLLAQGRIRGATAEVEGSGGKRWTLPGFEPTTDHPNPDPTAPTRDFQDNPGQPGIPTESPASGPAGANPGRDSGFTPLGVSESRPGLSPGSKGTRDGGKGERKRTAKKNPGLRPEREGGAP